MKRNGVERNVSKVDLKGKSSQKKNPRCPGCGYPVARKGQYCGECVCEDDCAPD